MFISLLACFSLREYHLVIQCTKHAKTTKIYLDFSFFVRRQSDGYFRSSEEKENIINFRISTQLQISALLQISTPLCPNYTEGTCSTNTVPKAVTHLRIGC